MKARAFSAPATPFLINRTESLVPKNPRVFPSEEPNESKALRKFRFSFRARLDRSTNAQHRYILLDS